MVRAQRRTAGRVDLPPLTPPIPTDPGWRPGRIVVQRPSPTRLEVQIQDSSGGWLVRYDRRYPRWKVTVNGTDAVLRRAQGLVRAVRIAAGDSRVRAKCEPRSLRYGAASSLLAVLASLIAAHERSRRIRRRAP